MSKDDQQPVSEKDFIEKRLIPILKKQLKDAEEKLAKIKAGQRQ